MPSLIRPLLFGLLSLGAASVAFGHAAVQSSIPAAGSLLQQSPQHIQIVFDEGLSAKASTLQLLNSQGKPVPIGKLKIQGEYSDQMSLSLPQTLAPGKYRINWQAVTADDGHRTHGSIAFTVTTEQATAATTANDSKP